ncbi:MAG: aminotransferase class I/II-fold pyridoxal phosphate-dependent enzyme [Candidatus Sumerlaeia bacterium]|nr:aminotransferase class I/II-fold pyridoxal phosphate-dependent enzyme [Candidatus Sumerlaeia bacterium]
MKFADRRQLIDSSGIRRIFELAAKMADPCDLSIGMPDFDVPEPVRRAAIDAIEGGRNRYTPTDGTPALRAKILEHYRARGLDFPASIVTSGTTGALYLLFLALLNPGDEVLVPDPYFVMYKQLLKFLGVKPVFVDTYPDFQLTAERLEAHRTPRTRMVICNTPNNPTGVSYSEANARAVAEFAQRHGLVLLSDEIYDAFNFDGPFVSPARFNPDTIVVGGLSKSVAITGWRIGWVLGNEELVRALKEIQQYTFVCAPSPAQEASVVALDLDPTEVNDAYRRKRDLVCEGLAAAGLRAARPGGAFYVFPEAPGGDGDRFVEELVKESLLVVPGSVFSERRTHFRISFAAPEARIRRGVDIIAKVARRFA